MNLIVWWVSVSVLCASIALFLIALVGWYVGVRMPPHSDLQGRVKLISIFASSMMGHVTQRWPIRAVQGAAHDPSWAGEVRPWTLATASRSGVTGVS